jgi:hypothetical protein
MNVKALAYWATTVLISLELLVGGATDLAHGREVIVAGQPVVEVMRQLGYPAYLLVILGCWKLLGAAAILAPGLPRLKEWAYAGTFFDLSGAAISGALAFGGGDSVVGPAVLALIALASWALRPAGRRLGMIGLDALVSRRPGRAS